MASKTTDEINPLRKHFRKTLKSCADNVRAEKDDVPIQELHEVFETKSRSTPKFDVEAVLAGFSSKELESIWKDVWEIVKSVVQQEDFLNKLEEHSMYAADNQESNSTDMDLRLLRNICSFLQAYLDRQESESQAKKTSLPLSEQILEVAILLHDQIFYLAGPEGSPLQFAIIKVCSTIWKQNRVGRENVILHTVPALLVLSLDENAKNADVKRVYEMRDAFELFDLEDESSDGLRELMLRCFMSPLYLRNQENRRVLEQFLLLSEGFVEDVHQAVKNQLPFSTKTYITAYQELYFKAWTRAEASIKQKIEESCIQDLMARGVHCSRQGTFNAVRTFLWNFTQQKKHKGVSELVSRLYAPVLWRALEAPNAKVRLNATLLFLDAFPLGNAKAMSEEFDETMQIQIDALSSLLTDRSADVRKQAVHGVCKVISIFWEILPPQTIKVWLKQLATDLVRDTSSPAVRQAVFEGLSFILDQPCAHDTMKQLLGTLWKTIHDKNDKVRIQFVKLLQQVQSIKGMHFYEIVPTEQLMARLSMDANNQTVCNELVKLLHPSFYPENSSGAELINRVIQSLTDYPAASLVLYKNLHNHLPVASVVKLILLVHKAVAKAIEKSEDRKRKRNDSSPLHVTNTSLMTAFLQSIVALWESISPSLLSEENEDIKRKLHEAFKGDCVSKWMSVLQSSNNSNEVGSCLIKIAGFVPEAQAHDIATSVRKQITTMSLEDNGTFSAGIIPLAEALSNWGFAEEFVNDCIKAMEKILGTTKGNKKKKVSTDEENIVSMWFAIEHILNYDESFMVDGEMSSLSKKIYEITMKVLEKMKESSNSWSSRMHLMLAMSLRVCCQIILRVAYSTSSFVGDETTLTLEGESWQMFSQLSSWFADTGLELFAKSASAAQKVDPSSSDMLMWKAVHESMATLLAFFSDGVVFNIPVEDWLSTFFDSLASLDLSILSVPVPRWNDLLCGNRTEGPKCNPFVSHLLRLVSQWDATSLHQKVGNSVHSLVTVLSKVTDSEACNHISNIRTVRSIRKQLFRHPLGHETWMYLFKSEGAQKLVNVLEEVLSTSQEPEIEKECLDGVMSALSQLTSSEAAKSSIGTFLSELKKKVSDREHLYQHVMNQLPSTETSRMLNDPGRRRPMEAKV